MIGIGLIGFGNVGQGIYQIFQKNGSLISQRLGTSIYIKKIAVRSVDKYSSLVSDPTLLTDSVDTILQDPDIQIVIEVMGGEFPAYDYITSALTQGKHVVTANKEVVSKHKQHFFQTARKHSVDFYFEAAVGGGIPVIRSLKVGFAANKINAFYGIVNGTTNYILTKIKTDKQDFEPILKQAQELGFAEADPSMDISGQDAAYKCAILAAVAFKIDVQQTAIYTEGIEAISLTDINDADKLGYAIKLLCFGIREGEGFRLHTYPALIPLNHPLASVHNEFNAVYIVGDQVGESMLMGKGAGATPTASAVMSDVMDLCFNISQDLSHRNLETQFIQPELCSFDTLETQFFFRISVENKAGVLEQVSLQFSNLSVSIETIHQKESSDDNAEITLVSSSLSQKTCNTLCENLLALPACLAINSKLRLHKTL